MATSAKRGRGRGAATSSHTLRLAMGAGSGSGPSLVAQGESDSAAATRAAVVKKIPMFFHWLRYLPDDHQHEVAKVFIPEGDDWTKLSTDHMIDRR